MSYALTDFGDATHLDPANAPPDPHLQPGCYCNPPTISASDGKCYIPSGADGSIVPGSMNFDPVCPAPAPVPTLAIGCSCDPGWTFGANSKCNAPPAGDGTPSTEAPKAPTCPQAPSAPGLSDNAKLWLGVGGAALIVLLLMK